MRKLFQKQWCYFVAFLSLVLFSGSLLAQQLPAGFALSQMQEGYNQPVGSIFSPDGQQLFVWEKGGRVWASTWNGRAYVRQPLPVLDIAEEVGDWRDFGLLSVCLDPNFRDNGLLYLLYVVDRHHLLYYGTPQYNREANEYNNATISRVTRYRVANTNGALAADLGSRRVLLGETRSTGVPLLYESHAAGTIMFGQDGSLLVSTGDNSSYSSTDAGSAGESYYQAALADGIMRPEENVGSFRSQMVNSLCGKVLRIDPNTGNGLPGNPFYDGGNVRSARSRVWALGLRNPFRMSIQPNTGSSNINDGNPGTLLVGDVGWDTYEEFHVLNQSGLNAGWPIYEGLTPMPGYANSNARNLDEPGQPTFVSLLRQPTSTASDPVAANRRFTHARPALDWHHTMAATRVPAFDGNTPTTRMIGTAGAPAGTPFGGNASMGGAYYAGGQFPDTYRNSYFVADFGQNWIKNVVLTQDGTNQVQQVREFAPAGFGQGIVDLKVNPRDGSLVYINIYTGQLMCISYGANLPPVARLSADVTTGVSPLRVKFTGTDSSDPEGNALTYRWDFGDGTTSTEANPEHVFASNTARGFTVTLTVMDNRQLTDTDQLVISANNIAPQVQITTPVDGSFYPVDKATYYQLQANVTDNNKDNMSYEWQVSLYHNNHHHDEPVNNEMSPTVLISPVGCSTNETYYYQIALKVTDNGGLSTTTYSRIYPDCNSLPVTVSNLTATPQVKAVRLSWQNPATDFDEILVVARANEDVQDHPSGTAYTADANFAGSGSTLGGGRIVYRGHDNSVTVTNMTPLTNYYFRVYTRLGTIWSSGIVTTAKPLDEPVKVEEPVNHAPVVAKAVTDQTALRNQAYQFTIPSATFTDPDDDAMTYALTGLPPGLGFADMRISGTPATVGSYRLQLKATDAKGLSATMEFGLTVTEPNLPPVVANPIGAQTTVRNQAYQFTIPGTTFTDPNGDALTYSLTGLPAGLSFTDNRISGTPATAGTYTLQLKATDTRGLSATMEFGLTVTEPAPVPKPAETPQGTLTLKTPVFDCASSKLTLSVTGGNGQPVEYNIPSVTSGWTTNNVVTLDAKALKKKKLTINARQRQTSGNGYSQAEDIKDYDVPACSSARVGVANEMRAELEVIVLDNPIQKNEVKVEVRGVAGQPVRYRLTDLSGRLITEQVTEQAEERERQTLRLGNQPAGLLLLQVSTPSQVKRVKLLKAD
jgi:glucose/arabinose dehydrogenase